VSRKLVLFVEGPNDGPAVANIVSRLLMAFPPELQGLLFADGNGAYKIGNVPKVSGKKGQLQWTRRLQRVQQEPNLGGVLVVLDGDEDYFEGHPFCATTAACTLAARAVDVGAGTTFSVAVVILLQEYESLLIAAAAQFPGIKANAIHPPNPEVAPRGAKKWLRDNLMGGYKESNDQLPLTQAVADFAQVRQLRCFQRLEKAVLELSTAISQGVHICTPLPK
jgi:hypothetical protein